MRKAYSLQNWLSCLLLPLTLAAVCYSQENQTGLAAAEKIQSEAEELLKKNTAETSRQAAVKFIEARNLWQKLGNSQKEADTLVKLIEASSRTSDMREALEYSKQLLPLAQKLSNRLLEAEALYNIGGFYNELGDTRSGLVYVQKTIPIFSELSDKKREAMAHNLTGILYSNIGEMSSAIESLQRSLVLRREVQDRLGEARTIINLGTVYNDTGEYRTAAEFYEQARKIAEEEKDLRTLSFALNNLGFVRHATGEYQQALESYRKALEIRRQIGDKRAEATALNNIGSIYRTLGETKSALELMNQALVIYQKGGFRRNEATSLSSIGALYSDLDDTPKALEFHQKALEIHRSIENRDGQVSSLRNISLIYLEDKRPQEALAFLKESLQLAEEIGNRERVAAILLDIARTYEQLNQLETAEAHFVSALKARQELGLPRETPETLYHYARFEERLGRRAQAIEKMREVMQIVEDLRNSITAPNLRSSYFAEQQRYFDFYISLLVGQHKSEPKKGFDALALKVSESAKARSLLESLRESQIDIRAGIAPDLLAQEKILRQTINAKETQRINAVREKSPEKAAEFEKELAEILWKYRELQARIRRASPQFASLTNPEPLDLAGIQTQVLDNNSVLLEYVLGSERSFLFFVTKNDFEIFELPKRETLENLARRTIENLKARGQEISGETFEQRSERLKKADASTEKNLLQLSEILLAPLGDKIQNKRLLVVASGILQYVPFAALINRPASVASGRISPQKPTNNGQLITDKGRFLIETNEIINLPSASILPVLRQNKTRPRETKNLVAILADPVFSNDDARLKQINKPDVSTDSAAVMREAKLLLPQMRSDFARLRFSRAEAEAISGFAPNSQRFVAMDFAASLKAVNNENLQKSRIVHLATHGVINSDYPELSGVVLSLVDETGKTQDGFLRLHDIYNLRLDADLVVLSACETALGKEINGEGIVGLTRGFMYAGASNVAASLWRVEDRATADLMKRFYQKMLGENLPPAAALRAAQISMIKEKTSAHPFYWAGFTLQGDWRR